MSEIKNVDEAWMALKPSKCNHPTPLHFKELTGQQLSVTLVGMQQFDLSHAHNRVSHHRTVARQNKNNINGNSNIIIHRIRVIYALLS